MTIESVDFLAPATDEPSALQLLYGLAGVTAALEDFANTDTGTINERDNLACAAHALAALLVSRMGRCPAAQRP